MSGPSHRTQDLGEAMVVGARRSHGGRETRGEGMVKAEVKKKKRKEKKMNGKGKRKRNLLIFCNFFSPEINYKLHKSPNPGHVPRT